jgi:ribose transport system substrate-binding protein
MRQVEGISLDWRFGKDYDYQENGAIILTKASRLLMKTGLPLCVSILLLCALLPLSGQGQPEEPAYLFGATYMTMNNPFFVALNDGIMEVLESRGDKLITLDPALDVEKQIRQVHDLIDQGVDLIFLNPVDWKEVQPALEAAEAAGIPVINVDSPVFDDEMVASVVTSDNYRAGVLIARDVYERVGSEARIILLEHPETKSGIDRTQAFLDTASSYPGLEIVARYDASGQLESTMPVMEKALQQQLDFNVVMCTNDPSAIGVLAALLAAKQEEGIFIYGVDGSPNAKKMVQEGKLTATVAQSPMSIGRTAAERAYDLLSGMQIPHEILVPVELIDSTNVDQFGLNGWQ